MGERDASTHKNTGQNTAVQRRKSHNHDSRYIKLSDTKYYLGAIHRSSVIMKNKDRLT